MGLFIVLALMFGGMGLESQRLYDECKVEKFEGKKCEWARKLNKLGGKK
jgi:hypothetical protein